MSCKALILMYHSIAEESPDPWSLCVNADRFEEQLQILRKQANPIRLPELVQRIDAKNIRQGTVVITCDDGYANNLYTAKPLLETYDIPATVFVAAGYLGQERGFWWDELESTLLQPGMLPDTLRLTVSGRKQEWKLNGDAWYSAELWQRHQCWKAVERPPTARHSLYLSLWRLLQRLPEEERQSLFIELREWAGANPQRRSTRRPLSIEEVPALADRRLIDIGSHTVRHPVLSLLPLKTQREEIAESKSALENLLSRKITSFAYPYGSEQDYTPETMSLVQEMGFDCACSTFPKSVTGNTHRYQLSRFHVENWDGDEFARRLSIWFHD